MPTIASCAVAVTNISFDKPYSYLLPPELSCHIGSRVWVPFGRSNRLTEGIVLDIKDDDSAELSKLKVISSVQKECFSLSDDFLQLAFWLRRRCYCTLFDIIHAMFPSVVFADAKAVKIVSYNLSKINTPEAQKALHRLGEKSRKALSFLSERDRTVSELSAYSGISGASLKALAEKGFVTFYSKSSDDSACVTHHHRVDPISPVILAPAQMRAYNGLYNLVFSNRYQCALLYGITGSGKTHIYMKLISDVLSVGKSVLMLVPEIALTPQMIQRFTAVFGNRIACLHSALGDRERRKQWFRIKNGEADVVIGTRSAVFAPISQNNLGLIILDEEHEPSYKSESIPRYHAREVAQYRASKSGILLLLGSATPSVETEYAARTGVISRFELTERFNQATLADVKIVNKADDLKIGNDNTIGSVLQHHIENALLRHEQTILFLNRRGRNRRLICTDCGQAVQCPNCTNALSYHGAAGRLICHICGHSQAIPAFCPSCQSSHLLPDKAGTQLIEEEIQRLFPGASYLRMDADSTSAHGGHSALLNRFEKEKIDILIGTQMVTKGLDFPNVTLVGVLDADMSLFSSDFRAGERTFSLLTQVVGRSGRGARQGQAIIQSYSPQNPILLASAAQNYDVFYQQEIALRKTLEMPPFVQVIVILFSGEQEALVAKASQAFYTELRLSLDESQNKLLGPARAEIYKASNRFRWSILIKSHSVSSIRGTIEGLMGKYLSKNEYKGVSVSVDENPYDLM